MSSWYRRLCALGVSCFLVASCTASDTGTGVGPPVTVAGGNSVTVSIDEPASCDADSCVGEGIETVSGAFQLEVEDLLFPSGLYGMQLVRSYRSDGRAVGWFGPGWATIYETRVVQSGGLLTVDAPAGFGPRWTPEVPLGWDVAGAVRVERSGSGHRFVWPTGETWDFGADGHLITMRSPYGQELTIDRTPTLITIQSSQGARLELTVVGDRVVGAETSDGRTVSYDYNDDRLTRADAPGHTASYRHDAEGRLVEHSGPAGATSVVYDAVGRVVSQAAASGERFELAYSESSTTVSNRSIATTYIHDTDGRVTSVERAGEVILARRFDNRGQLIERTEYAWPGGAEVSSLTQTFNGQGWVDEVIVDGVRSTFEYDERGRVVAVGGAGESAFEYREGEPLPVAVTTPATGRTEILSEGGFTVQISDSTGLTSLTQRDAVGNPVAFGFTPDALWRFEFDAEGNLTSSTSALGRSWKSEWGPRARLLEERDPISRVSQFEYDSAGRLLTEDVPTGTRRYAYTAAGQLASVESPDGSTIRRQYASDGRLAAIVRPGDRTWRISTDIQPDGSRRETTTAPDGTSVEEVYDSADRLMERRSFESDRSLTEQITYDYEYGREVAVVIQRGSSELIQTTAYDEIGRVVGSSNSLDGSEASRTSYEYDRGLITRATVDDIVAEYEHDEAGRLISIARGDDAWSATYRGGQVASVDHNGQSTVIGYDIDGRATTFGEPDGTSVQWQFDGVDRPVRRTVAGSAAEFLWSDADLLVGHVAPSGATWEWSYDLAGRLAEVVEPGGVNTLYEYVDGNTSRIRSSGPGVDRDDRYAYDARGLLASADTTAGDVSYLYDAAGRVRAVDGFGGEEVWTLDASGAIAAVEAGSDRFELSNTPAGEIREVSGPDEASLVIDRRDGVIHSINVDGERSLRIRVDDAGRITSVDWDADKAIDVTWRGAESFSVSNRGDDERFVYEVSQGRLISFGVDETQYRARARSNGELEELALIGDNSGTLEFDVAGRPATVRTDDRVSSISYDDRGRVSSVITSDGGEIDERTVVTYTDGNRDVDGDDSLVKALFDELGAPLQPLPNSLPNPTSASIADDLLAGALLVQGADALLEVQPDPFATIVTSLRQSTPVLTAPIGVTDLDRLAERLLVAEVNRLSPTISVAGSDRVRVPLLDPDDGDAASFNPFVDAAPSGLAFGVLSREAGAGDSLLSRARDTAADIVGGTVSIVSSVASFVVANPLARSVLVTAAAAAGFVTCPPTGGVACLLTAVIAGTILVGDASVTLLDVVPAALAACTGGDAAGCGLNVARAGLAVGQLALAARMGTSVYGVLSAGSAVARSAGTARATASGRLGAARSELRSVLRYESVIGREVPVCTATTCARADMVVRTVTGRIRLVETKNGAAARLTPNQRLVYPQLETTPVTFPRGLSGSGQSLVTIAGRPRIEHWGAARAIGL